MNEFILTQITEHILIFMIDKSYFNALDVVGDIALVNIEKVLIHFKSHFSPSHMT